MWRGVCKYTERRRGARQFKELSNILSHRKTQFIPKKRLVLYINWSHSFYSNHTFMGLVTVFLFFPFFSYESFGSSLCVYSVLLLPVLFWRLFPFFKKNSSLCFPSDWGQLCSLQLSVRLEYTPLCTGTQAARDPMAESSFLLYFFEVCCLGTCRVDNCNV